MSLTALLFLTGVAVPAGPQIRETPEAIPVRQEDPYIDGLLSQCVLIRKVNSANRRAACHLLASALRHERRWDVLMKMLHEGQGDERNIVHVLGRIAAVDARARDILALPEEERMHTAWIPDIALDDTVVPELLARAEKANRHMLDAYVTALARARDRRTVDFLRRAMRNDAHLPSSRFHAAVGLANLSDAEAIEWLIAHTDSEKDIIDGPWPRHPQTATLNESCFEALRQLTGNDGLTTKADWQAWWARSRESFRPQRVIRLVECDCW